MDKYALIEFGTNDKIGAVIIKGGNKICLSQRDAHVYWYPDNLTQEEIICEINDLKEHYENVGIFTPLPQSMNIKTLISAVSQIDRSESEVSA